MDGGCFLRDLSGLVGEAAKVGLEFGVSFGPVAVEPLGKGKRLPYLVALFDKEEREEAVRLTRRNLDVIRGLGATRFVVDLGLRVLCARVRRPGLRPRQLRCGREKPEGSMSGPLWSGGRTRIR